VSFMKRDARSFAGIVLAGLIALASTGCPDTEVFNTGTYEVALVTSVTNAGDASCVMMQISLLRIVPLDGTCKDNSDPCFDDVDCPGSICVGAGAADSLPGDFIEVVVENLDFSNFLDQGQPCPDLPLFETGQDFSMLVLSPGLYQIRALHLDRWAYVTSVVTTPAEFDVVSCGYRATIEEIPEYDEGRFFTIGEDQPNRIEFVIDGAALKANVVGLSQSECLLNLRHPAQGLGEGGILDVFSIQ
jgi:hypothetical protein